jgi:AraC family transcriptional regulator
LNADQVNREQTLRAWRLRMQNVTTWLVANLDQPLQLDRLADLAHFSPYHFHRIYTVTMGETVADTVRRMRIHRAAVYLATTDASILSIAKRSGYSTAQAFTRAFTLAHKESPAQYRSRSALDYAAARKSSISNTQQINKSELLIADNSPIELSAQLVELPAVRVVALRHHGAYTSIHTSFQLLTAWAVGRGLLDQPTRMFGMYYDDPHSKESAFLQSDACIAVPDNFELDATKTNSAPQDIRIAQTSSGLCAQTIFTGPYADLNIAYTWLYHQFIVNQGREPGGHPALEEYLNDPRNTHPTQLQTAVSIPLKA